MIQMIYKELMLMGLVSFAVIMIEASNVDSSEQPDAWIIGKMIFSELFSGFQEKF